MKKFNAFTLAEVMIVIVIIGVVAVFTMPVLLSEVTERVNSNRQANIVQKVTKAVELMIVNGDYEQFETTEEFADKLQKYLKTVKRCNNNNLTQCWSSNTVTKADGSKYNVANAKTGKDLHTVSTTNTVGFILADGGNIILTYNPNATIPNADAGFKATKKNLPIGGGKTKEFAYTSNATSAIDFVMDVNGAQGPNAETDNDGNYYDIRSFKVASFSNAGCLGYKVNGVCVYELGKSYNSVNCAGDQPPAYCDGGTQAFNYNAGAQKACKDIGMVLPDSDTLLNLLNTGNEKLPSSGSYISSSLVSAGKWHNYVYYNNNYWTSAWNALDTTQYDVICLGY